MEKRTDGEDEGGAPQIFTRVGDADLCRKPDEREEKVEVEEANADDEAEAAGEEWNLPEGE